MTRQELLIHMLQVVLNLAIAIGRIAETPEDKARAKLLENRLDEWLGLIVPKEF